MLKKLFLYIAIIAGSVLFFSIFVLVFMNGTAVTCTRMENKTYTCYAQTMLLGEFPTFIRHIEQITGVDTFSDGCSDGCSYRTEFILTNGTTVPLTEVYSDEGPVLKQTNELNSLLKSGRSSFEYYREPTWWVAYLLGGLFIMEFFIVTISMGADMIRHALRTRDALPD